LVVSHELKGFDRLREIVQIAWERLKVIASIVGDAQAQAIATLFYFTIMIPFGLISRFSTDPLQSKSKTQWLEREAVPTDLEAAKRQG
jgi:hypothetical protein